MAVDISKFDKGFRNHPSFNQIVTEANKSPLLVELINKFPGKIELGEPGSAGYFEPAVDRNGRVAFGGNGVPTAGIINIDKDWVDQISISPNPKYLGQFTTMLAHELGHACEPEGYPKTNYSMPSDDYVNALLKGEGVAILAEYRVARQLHTQMWSSDSSPNGLQAKLDAELATNRCNFADKASEIGANHYASQSPSGVPHLNYKQYYETWYALAYGHSYTSGEIERIDWKKVKPEHIATKPGANREFLNARPLSLKPPVSALQQGQATCVQTSDAQHSSRSAHETYPVMGAQQYLEQKLSQSRDTPWAHPAPSNNASDHPSHVSHEY
ncbi:MAG: hypothetical protein FWF12_09030 [Betaproteobacteria bacterium]|nr:hypothetical protein [Betaproteobacteria bacterium]